LDLLPLRKALPEPTDDIHTLLEVLASRSGNLKKGGEANTEAAEALLLQSFRDGTLGKFTLDDLRNDLVVMEEQMNGFTRRGNGARIQESRDEDEVSPTIEGEAVTPTPTAPVDSDGNPLTSSNIDTIPPIAPSTPISAPSNPKLDRAVSEAVLRFIAANEETAELAADGKGLSISQMRKVEKKEVDDKRYAKWKAAGFPGKPSRGGFGSRSRGRGGPVRRGRRMV
jgi:hypothetical protein